MTIVMSIPLIESILSKDINSMKRKKGEGHRREVERTENDRI